MYRIATSLLALAFAASAATLEKLSVDAMVMKSTDIVRGRVTPSSASFWNPVGRNHPARGGIIYTHFTIRVTDRWKGSPAQQMDVAVPGGVAQGYRQTFSGVPALNASDEYLFFLWTSPSGLTQIIGLTQGLFAIHVDASGKLMLSRGAATEPMVDPVTKKPVMDHGLQCSLEDLVRRVQVVLTAAGARK